jgi:uncharacterized protein (TIGR02145 family)
MNRKMFFAQNIMADVKGGYGYLYNWYSISHANFAPTGWHVPTESDFNTLVTYLGGSGIAGGKLKETGYDYWKYPNTGATNSSNFTSYGSGTRSSTGAFLSLMELGQLYSSSFITGIGVFDISYDNDNTSFGYSGEPEVRKMGFAVRLIKDSTSLSNGQTSTMTDYDGNVYDTICIGTQEWTVQNWKCTKLNDGTPLTKVTDDTTWANAGTGDLYYCAYNNDESYV